MGRNYDDEDTYAVVVMSRDGCYTRMVPVATIPPVLTEEPRTLSDVLRQVAAVQGAWGLWHLDDPPTGILPYRLAGVEGLLEERRGQWWDIAAREGYDLHEFALDIT